MDNAHIIATTWLEGRTQLTSLLWCKLCQEVPHLECLGKMIVLIHVNGLQSLPVGKDDGMVLVLGLALADDDTTARVPDRRSFL